MKKEDVKEYLATDEGQELAEELKSGLLKNRDDILRERNELQSKLKDFESTEKARQAKLEQDLKLAEEKRLKETGDFDAYKQHMEDQLKAKEAEMSTFQSKYATTEIDRIISRTAAKHTTATRPLELLIRERVSPRVNEDGSVEYVVKDNKGETMYYDGKPATIDHLIEDFRNNADYQPFFASRGVSGSGTVQSAPASTSSYKDMSSTDFNLSKAMGNKL